MKNKVVIQRKGGAFLIFLLSLLTACSSPVEKEETEKAEEKEKTTMHAVEITKMMFYPAELKVKKGDKVVFVNHDLVTHDVTEASGKTWRSDPLTTDQTFILDVTETVNYYCSIHPVMKGRVVVE